MNFKDNLKKLRKDNNLSQEDLAEKLNVSRQSVSKWEQGLAYPEMDKVLQICKMFDLNIDELLNQNVKEVKNNKESKINVNKYIEDFLSFVTKTIDMFSNMKFKQKIKCIFEQLFLILIFYIIVVILGNILSSIFSNLLSFLPYQVFNIFSGLYSIFAFIVIFVSIIYIFKVRYLDYYILVDKKDINNEDKEESKDENNKEDETKFIERKQEKVIIRDPEHSSYKFISAIIKFIVFCIKMFLGFIGTMFCLSLVMFAILLVISFLFVKTGLLFVGTLLGLIACIIINFIILDIIYKFIVNVKVKKSLVGIILISSVFLGGISLGLVTISFKDFKVLKEYNSKYMSITEEKIDLNNGFIYDNGNVQYIETDSKDVKVEYEHASYCEVKSYKYFYNIECDNFNDLNKFIRMINDKVIVSPDYLKIKVYASKENMKKLKENKEKYEKGL